VYRYEKTPEGAFIEVLEPKGSGVFTNSAIHPLSPDPFFGDPNFLGAVTG